MTASLTLADFDIDQALAADHIFESDSTLLIAGMGAGKTAIALTAIEELLAADLVNKVLVLAPLKVCNKVWKGEHKQWQHTQNLKVSVITGDDRAFDPYAQVIVVNFDLLPWLVEQYWFAHFDALVIDEATKLKAGGTWFKALRHQIKKFRYRLVMTGTPVSENWAQLFYIMFLVDGGATFGRNREKWLRKHFYPTDYDQRNWEVIPGQESVLAAMIEPFTHVVPDYTHTLPPLTVQVVQTPLPPLARQAYREMAGKFETQGVLAQNAAAKSMKLTQIANGFIYNDKHEPLKLHDEKMDMVETIIKSVPKSIPNFGHRFIVVYQFTAELEQLREKFPDLAVLDTAGHLADDWNAGRLNIMAMHPKSGGHGLCLEAGGCKMIWMSAPWSRDLLTQTIARLWRRKQINPVDVWILAAPDTVDEIILARQETKSAYMPLFLEHLAAQNAL